VVLISVLFVGLGSVWAEKDPALSEQPIALNQIGYESGGPKRFTAPKASEGTKFSVRSVTGGDVLFQGSIQRGIGDFSSLKPADSTEHYFIEVNGEGASKVRSDPFLIRSNLYQEQFWQTAVDFLIDSRSAIGTYPGVWWVSLAGWHLLRCHYSRVDIILPRRPNADRSHAEAD
jgi:hypothetical protein